MSKQRTLERLENIASTNRDPLLDHLLAIDVLLEHINDEKITESFKRIPNVYKICSACKTKTRLQKQISKYKKYSLIDTLTDTYNRRALDKDITRYIEMVKRHKNTYGLSVIDVDNLKKMNDNFGHEAGDKLLKKVAEVLKLSVRNTDKIYRIGGDEFVIIYSNFKDSNHAISRIKKSLSQYNIEISIGCAIMSEKAFEIADKKMYAEKMKKKGRR